MKIAIFSDTFLPQINGVTKTLAKMKDYMEAKGIDYRFIVPKSRELNEPYSKTIAIDSINFILYPECQLSLPRSIYVKQMLDQFKPDCIHIVTPFTLGLIGLNYAKRKNIPIFASYHTDFPKYLKHYKLELLESVVWKFFCKFHRHAEINFCPSMHTKHEMERNGIGRVEIWGRGIDKQRFNKEKYSETLHKRYCEDNEKMLLYVGRLAPEKELDVLIEAAKELNRNGESYKLVLVGDGPQKEELQQRGVENVVFAGYKKGDTLAQYYATADIFVFPSSSETYGNVILEAMASGLPIIAPLSGGIKENLIDGYNGLAFESGNSQDMSQKISMILKNNALRSQLSEQADEYTNNKTWDAIYSQLFKRYEKTLLILWHQKRMTA